MMTDYEYKFLTSRWDEPRGAAFNQVFAFCRSFGWCAGLDTEGRPVLTTRGMRAINNYQKEQNTS